MPSSHLILCRPLLLLPPIPPSIDVFSNETTLPNRWPKYWSFSFSIIPSKEIPGLISFRMDWLDLLALGPTSCLGCRRTCVLVFVNLIPISCSFPYSAFFTYLRPIRLSFTLSMYPSTRGTTGIRRHIGSFSFCSTPSFSGDYVPSVSQIQVLLQFIKMFAGSPFPPVSLFLPLENLVIRALFKYQTQFVNATILPCIVLKNKGVGLKPWVYTLTATQL